MDSEIRAAIVRDYTEAVNQCCQILGAVDRKYGTYAIIEVKNLDVTTLGESFPQYLRNLEWREIRIQ